MNRQKKLLLVPDNSAIVVHQILQSLFQRVSQKIKENSLLTHLNEYTSIQTNIQILQSFKQISFPQWKNNFNNISNDQNSKINQDAFMNYHIPLQKNQFLVTSHQISDNQKQTSKSIFKTNSGVRKSQDQKQGIIKLDEQKQDLLIQKIRLAKENRKSQQQKVIQQKQKRQRILKQNIQRFRNVKNFTFDFNNQVIYTKTNPQVQSITVNIKYKDGKNDQLVNQKNKIKIEKQYIQNKIQKSFNNPRFIHEVLNESINDNDMATSSIPQFLRQSDNNKNLTLNDFRKRHSTRYTPHIFKNTQIEVKQQMKDKEVIVQNKRVKTKKNSFSHTLYDNKDKNRQQNVLFEQRKRKFTLPKLNGKYDLLEKYSIFSERETIN